MTTKSWITRLVLASLAACLLLALMVVGLFLAVVGSPHCGYEILREAPSPDNTRKAVVVVSNCGATTPFVTLVYLIRYDETFDSQTSDSKKNDFFFSVKGRNDIDIVWNENYYHYNAVLFKVIYQKPETIYRQAVVWRTDRFEYEPRP